MEKNIKTVNSDVRGDKFEVEIGNCGISAEALEERNKSISLATDVVEAVKVALGMREGGQDSRFISNDPNEVMRFANRILTTFGMSDLMMWERAKKYAARIKKEMRDMGFDISDTMAELYGHAYMDGELAQNDVDKEAYMKERISVEFRDKPAVYYVCVRERGTINVYPCTISDYTPTNTNKPAVELSWRDFEGNCERYVIYNDLLEVAGNAPKAYSNGLITFCRTKEQCRKVLKLFVEDKCTELKNEIERLDRDVKANETLLEDYENRDAYWVEAKLNENLNDQQ